MSTLRSLALALAFTFVPSFAAPALACDDPNCECKGEGKKCLHKDCGNKDCPHKGEKGKHKHEKGPAKK